MHVYPQRHIIARMLDHNLPGIIAFMRRRRNQLPSREIIARHPGVRNRSALRIAEADLRREATVKHELDVLDSSPRFGI